MSSERNKLNFHDDLKKKKEKAHVCFLILKALERGSTRKIRAASRQKKNSKKKPKQNRQFSDI